MSRTLTRSRVLATLLVSLLALVALVLRAWHLESVPTSSGDESNWLLVALALSRNAPGALSADAQFVTRAYAFLVSLAFGIAAPTFAAARSVAVLAVLVSLVTSAHRAFRLADARAAVLLAALVALHPWSLAWSRTASVPYALSFALCLFAPLYARDALTPSAHPLRYLVAAHALLAGFHFSPLALVPVIATALTVPAPRALVRRPALWLAFASALAHPLAVLSGVRTALATTPADTHPFTDLPHRLATFASALVDSLAGTSTLRHFAGLDPLGGAWPARVCVVVCVCIGVAVCRRNVLARMGVVHLAVALVVLPAMLLRGRDWYLPAIDSDRYAFVLVAPFVVLCAGLASDRRRVVRALPWLLVTLVAVTVTYPFANAFVRGGGTDDGVFTQFGGGGYRGWKVARGGDIQLVERILARVRDDTGALPAVLAIPDYAYHPITFVRVRDGVATVRTSRTVPVQGRAYVVVWSPGVFADGFVPEEVRNEAMELRGRVAHGPGSAMLERFVQPDGAPLCEVWRVRP